MIHSSNKMAKISEGTGKLIRDNFFSILEGLWTPMEKMKCKRQCNISLLVVGVDEACLDCCKHD